MAPTFSVLIPAYNAERTLASTLASLDVQTEGDLEAIVVDDGSSDGTAAEAERLCAPRGWTVLRQANAGPNAARNAALRVATGRYVALLDADDWLLPRFLERMRGLLESGGEVGLVFGDAWIWDETRRRFARRSASGRYRPRPMPTERWEVFLALKETNFVYGAACFPRALTESLGGFDERLRLAEDWEMWMRMAATTARVIGVDERLAVYRRRPGQASKDGAGMHLGQRAALVSVLEACDLPPHVRAAVEDRIARQDVQPVGTDPTRSAARELAGRATRWLGPVRDFRARAPREVVDALGRLR